MLIFMAFCWTSLSLVPVQAFTLDQCKGLSQSGYLECTTSPQEITAWRYMIPGYVFKTPYFFSEIDAIENYKAQWAAKIKTCKPIPHTFGGFDLEWESEIGHKYNNWDYGQLTLARRRPYTITISDRSDTVDGACVVANFTSSHYLYHHREAACAEGWVRSNSDPRSDFCYLYDPEEADTCPTWNPVYPSTGVKIHHEDDLSGAGLHPLHLTRFYRSHWINGTAPETMPFGVGWTHTYDRAIKIIQGAPVPTVRVLRGNGTTRTFLRDEGASTPTARQWRDVSPNTTQDRLTEHIAPSGETQGWQYTVQTDDSLETYDASGRLQTIDARNGWRTTLTYSNTSTPASEGPEAGRLLSVRNAFGRELRLSYDSAGRIATLTAPGGEDTRYAYDPLGNLVSVTRADGTTTGYHYEDSRRLNQHALTGLTDALGVRTATYSYDANGRTASTEKAGGLDKLQFQYSLNAGSSGSSSVIYYTPTPGAASTSTLNYYSSQAGVLRPTSTSTPPCPLCGSSYKSVSYDADKRKTKTIAHDGAVSFIRYDTQGRVTEKATYPASHQSATTAPPLDAASGVTQTQWHPTWNLPLKTAEAYLITSYSYDSKGNLLERIETPTPDATGAQGFNAAPSGEAQTTRWTYDERNLPTGIVELEGGTETGRWEMVYNATGDLTGITHVTSGTVATLVPQGDGSSLITEIIGELDEPPAGASIASLGASRMVGISAGGGRRGSVDIQPKPNGGEAKKGDTETACKNPFDAAINVIRPDYCKNKQKEKEKCDPVVYPRNPDDYPEDFHKQKYSGKAWKNKYDGSMWETDNSQHGGSTWKRWKDQKTWERFPGKYESVRDNGTVR
jgi:YD repeat-containing protein